MNTGHEKEEKFEELRPYEKFEKYGAEALTDPELLAVVIKSGCKGKSAVELAAEILYPHFDDTDSSDLKHIRYTDSRVQDPYRDNAPCGLVRLMNLSEDDVRSMKGIGRVKLIQLCCIAELSKRIATEQAVCRLNISSPDSVADYYMEMLRHKSEEEVHVMLLNSRNNIIKSVMISMGTATYSAVSPREIFMAALKYKASGVIVVHNHPSGDPEPSSDDIVLSEKLKELGTMMSIPLRDFLIIGDNRYTSFLERGLF